MFRLSEKLGFHVDQIAQRIVEACVWIILICSVSALITLVLLFVLKYLNERKDRRRAALEDKYSLLLTGVIFGEADEASQREKLIKHFRKRYMRSRFQRKVLRIEILKLHTRFSGQSADVLHELYHGLKLYKDPMRDLKETDWSLRAEAVRELVQMHHMPVLPKLERLSRHEHPVLRLEAQLGLLVLSPDNPFQFLHRTKSPLTRWHQICLEEMANRIPAERMPDFSVFFQSANASVIEFALRMKTVLNQFGATEQLMPLLHHKQQGVRLAAVKAAGQLMMNETEPDLIGLYAQADEPVQTEILRTLAKIGSDDSLALFREVLLGGKYEQALFAAKGLVAFGAGGQALLRQISNDAPAPTRVNQLTLHALDQRI